jgi:hypothetical protein
VSSGDWKLMEMMKRGTATKLNTSQEGVIRVNAKLRAKIEAEFLEQIREINETMDEYSLKPC